MTNFNPELKTIFAASGSQLMLNSAAGVIFPNSTEPKI